MTLEQIKGIAEPACKRFGVKRLDAFESMARGTSTESSDVDLLVEFGDSDQSLAQRFFGLLHYLEDMLGCDVDLVTQGRLRNPYFRDRVLRERTLVYEG
jgi:predicted nucleotidyltransferase